MIMMGMGLRVSINNENKHGMNGVGIPLSAIVSRVYVLTHLVSLLVIIHRFGWDVSVEAALTRDILAETCRIFTLWLFNIAMENGPFMDDFPTQTSIYKGFSMAMLNNQRVNYMKLIV